MNFQSKLIMPAAIAAAVLILGAGGYFYYKGQTPQVNPNDPQAAQEEVRKLVAEVGKLIDLPAGENPTIATVTDVDKLRNQPFFQKAQNGDKVLIYQGAGKAILYSPSLKKVLDVSPLNIGTGSAQVATPSASPSQ